MKKGLLIFDLDGTLADTIWSIRDAVNRTLIAYNMPQRSYEEIRLAIGNGARELIRRSVSAEAREDEALLDRIFLDYDRNYGETCDRIESGYPGISEALSALHQRGYTMAVLSNKQDALVRRVVEVLFPKNWFAAVVGQTDLPRKPAPDVPLMIAEKLGFLPGESFFIGDSEVDIQTAQNAGMTSIGCAWGYRGYEALRKAGADRILENPRELSGVFA